MGKTKEIKEILKGVDKTELGKVLGLTLEVIGNLEQEKGEVTKRLMRDIDGNNVSQVTNFT